MSRRVVITGMGCASGLGIGSEQSWQRVVRGEGAIRPTVREIWKDEPDLAIDGPSAVIDFDELTPWLEGKDIRRLGKLDPLSSFALVAAIEAVDQAGLAAHPSLDRKCAVLLGCGSGGNATYDTAFERLYVRKMPKVHPQTIPSSMISAPASHIGMLLGIHGPSFVLASACASSAHALGEAMFMIRSGRVDVAIAGGSDACVSLGSWFAWQSLGAMAPDSCRPFSRDRKGMVLGEGAAILVLESEEHAAARGATILGELAGYGTTSDAGQMTAPDQDSIEAAIRAAHEDAGVEPDQPALISSHGTGTLLNDQCEAAAIRSVYGKSLDDKIVIATKSAHGHLIGASGALEFLIGLKALASGMAPPILNYLGPDPDCTLPLALEPVPVGHEVLVSNSFAFGGLNVVLIGKVHP